MKRILNYILIALLSIILLNQTGCSKSRVLEPGTSVDTLKDVNAMTIRIEGTHSTIQGQHEQISIYLDNMQNLENAIGGYNLLIQYDPNFLSLTDVIPGELVKDCGWEYFTYQYGSQSNCGSEQCPSGVVRLISVANYYNGLNQPPCLITKNGELAKLDFLISDDRSLECSYLPIRFVWYDCGDNTLSPGNGDILFISDQIFDFDLIGEISNRDTTFPSVFGANNSCDLPPGNRLSSNVRLVDFYNGGIDFTCSGGIETRGDINLNEIQYEISDARLFVNYFIYGLKVFDVNIEGQVAETDANADGITLSVADLVYLIRVIVGETLPYPDEYTNETTTTEVNYHHETFGVLSISDSSLIGGVYLELEGYVTPTLLADNMEMVYRYDGSNTRVLIYSYEANSFTGEFLNTNSAKIATIEIATFDGKPVKLTLIQ